MHRPSQGQAREHGFAHDTDRRYPLIWRAIVSGRDDDDQVEIRHDVEPLAAIAGRTHPMLQMHLVGSAKLHVAEIPLIAVALQLADGDARNETLRQPFGRDDLAPTDPAVVDHELADPREIA